MTESEYFTVRHRMTINVEMLPPEFSLPSEDAFEAQIPTPFRVANEFCQLDQMAENARSELKQSDFTHVIGLLDAQNAKLNLLLSFMLAQQDDESLRFFTTDFGASEVRYLSPVSQDIGQLARVKLFIDHPAAAIFCYAEVIRCETVSDAQTETGETQYRITLRYQMLRDIDQDLLIKAALYQQQKLLRQRSLERERK
ncbi:PilZ domain-containing protein [Vibrio sp. SM6]|uniref:PilZ domain-containing protein n=1 Tax=Vibrio agarilyticus TaxID=2726741 RepID=A0A7X8TQE4_9VIBR|nr:PilZ domain-containing protein [Vibrio agarilyticus]NLS13047.1 PilZ domain-containing protein [Vibrio agarilyticus]